MAKLRLLPVTKSRHEMSPLIRFGFWFCKTFHRSAPYWPGREYQCRRCLRRFPVCWAGPRLVTRPPMAREETGIQKVWREQDEIRELQRMFGE